MTTTSPIAPSQITFLQQHKATTKGTSGATVISVEKGEVSEATATTNDTQAASYSYILFPISLPANASVESATVTFTINVAWAGPAKTIEMFAITNSWSPTAIAWNTRPSVRAGDPITHTFSNGAKDATFTVNVTPHIVAATTGTAWFGWMVRSTDVNTDKLYGKGTKEPKLTIVYNIGHKKPTNPRPGSGTENVYVATGQPDLELDSNIFISGHTAQAMQVQLSNTATRNASGAFSSPAWSSAETAQVTSRFVLSSVSGAPTASNGSGYYWVGRLKGTDGIWSPWSDPVKWIRQDQGTLAITNPAGPPNNYVEDSTPPLAWTLTGKTQVQYQYVIYDADTGLPITTSQVYTSADSSITPATNIVTINNKDYIFEIRTWDQYATQRQPAFVNGVAKPAFATANRTFRYQLNASTTGVSALSITNFNPKPYVRLNWSRATEPDGFEIVRNGIVIATNLSGQDAHKSGTTYYWNDYFPPPLVPLTYEVRAIVNNVTSATNPTVTTTSDTALGWLADLDNEIFIAISGETPVAPVLTEVGSTHSPLNSRYSVHITSSLHGYSGTVEGGLCGECIGDGTTSEELQQQLLAFRDEPGKRLHMSIGNISIPVTIFDVTTAPRYGPAFGNIYSVSFNFHEVE